MKNTFLLFLFVGLLISCNSNENTKKEDSEVQETSTIKKDDFGAVDQSFPKGAELTYKIEKIITKDESCTNKEDECSRVILEYPEFTGEGSNDANVTTHLYLSELLGYGSQTPGELMDLNEKSKDFIEAYHEFVTTSGSNQLWYAETQVVGHTFYKGYISIKIKVIFDMGGAHPNTYYKVLIFDQKTGEEVRLINHFTDDRSIQMLAENEFRNQLGYSDGQNLNSKGFAFENDMFVLPQNMNLTEEGVELIYNAYEIGAYSQGATTILLTFDQLGSLFDLENNYNNPL